MNGKHIAAELSALLISFSAFAQHYELPLIGHSGQVIRHSAYTALYSDRYKEPLWVAWDLTAEEVAGTVQRSNQFQPDPSIKSANPPTSMDYSRSGYDRGHLIPAADCKWSDDAMMESFYIGTNVCPQDHTLNEKTWCDLEKACRSWARRTTVYIVSGPLFSGTPKTIGNNHVAVPNAFWKAVLRQRNGHWEAIAFVMPNSAIDDDFHHYACSVDEVEKKTGFDLFSALPSAVQNEVEAQCIPANWRY